MSDIYDGNAESDRELEFWEFAKLIEAKPILEKITCAQKLGLDIEAFLDGYIYSVEKRNNNLKQIRFHLRTLLKDLIFKSHFSQKGVGFKEMENDKHYGESTKRRD